MYRRHQRGRQALDYAEQDGAIRGEIVSADRINKLYSHVTGCESVVSAVAGTVSIQGRRSSSGRQRQ